MKNIFKTNINLSSNIKLFANNQTLSVRGPQGSLFLKIPTTHHINLSIAKKKAKYPLFFRSLQKAVVGVSLGFIVRLIFVGVGFRVESLSKNLLKLKLGFSHFVFIKIPPYITIFSPKKTRLILKSIDEQLLKEFSSKICSFKFPDIYRGKGILYKYQKLVLKEGKKK